MFKISKKKLLGFYKLSRVKTIMEFYPFIIIFGFIGSKSFINISSITLSISILLILIGAFIINDIEDAEDDAKDPKKVNRNPISAGILTKGEGYLFFGIINLIALALLLLVSVDIWLIGVITALIGYLYSSKPLRLKSRPLVDLLSHGFFLAAAQVLMFTFLPGSTRDLNAWYMFLGLYLFSMGGDLYNELRDWEVDRKVGLKNTASFLGYHLSRIASYLFYGLGIIFVTISSLIILFN